MAGLTETEIVNAIREADKLCDNALASVWGEWRSRGVALWLAREDDVCRLPADSGWVLEGVRRKPSVRDLNSCSSKVDAAHPRTSRLPESRKDMQASSGHFGVVLGRPG